MHAVVFSGVQGAGKTTLYFERFAATHVRLSLDVLKTRHREDILLHACLAAKQPFVVDNTNPTDRQRRRYRALALAAGFRADLYWFDVPLELALARNAGREGRARVPDVAVRGTFRKVVPPGPGEGWSAVYVVRPGDGGVVVSPMPPGA